MSNILFQFPAVPNVYCLFSGRDPQTDHKGNISWNMPGSGEETSRKRVELFNFASAYGLYAWAECSQVHGSELLCEPEPVKNIAEAESRPQADGMMTTRPGLGLLIKTADCQPILLTDREGKHIMALHAGWRGNRNRFPQTAVETFCSHYNLSPENLYAIRGPSLGPCQAEFINFDSEWGDEFKTWFNPVSGCMDLWALTRAQLSEAGVNPGQILEIPICTATNHHAWFSYRRDHTAGRQASLIWIAKTTTRD